jgi:hypothetical protein
MSKRVSKGAGSKWWQDICEARKLNGMGCPGCVLTGTVGCREFSGAAPVPGMGLDNGYSGKDRGVEGFRCLFDTGKI